MFFANEKDEWHVTNKLENYTKVCDDENWFLLKINVRSKNCKYYVPENFHPANAKPFIGTKSIGALWCRHPTYHKSHQIE